MFNVHSSYNSYILIPSRSGLAVGHFVYGLVKEEKKFSLFSQPFYKGVKNRLMHAERTLTLI